MAGRARSAAQTGPARSARSAGPAGPAAPADWCGRGRLTRGPPAEQASARVSPAAFAVAFAVASPLASALLSAVLSARAWASPRACVTPASVSAGASSPIRAHRSSPSRDGTGEKTVDGSRPEGAMSMSSSSGSIGLSSAKRSAIRLGRPGVTISTRPPRSSATKWPTNGPPATPASPAIRKSI